MTTSKIIGAAVCGLALITAGAASAETIVRVKNASELPATIQIDKKSRDVKPRKAASFPITGTTGMLGVLFANGDVSKGEFDVSSVLPVENAEDGNTYYCIILDTETFDTMTKDACEALVLKKK
jgi:hypothetical protein